MHKITLLKCFWHSQLIYERKILSLHLHRPLAQHSPLTLSKAHRVMYGITSNSGPFTWLDNFSIRIFPFLLNTSTNFSSTLKWKAGVSSLRWVAHRCPAVHQYKQLVLKTAQQTAELRSTVKLTQSELVTGQLFPLTTTNQMMAV